MERLNRKRECSQSERQLHHCSLCHRLPVNALLCCLCLPCSIFAVRSTRPSTRGSTRFAFAANAVRASCASTRPLTAWKASSKAGSKAGSKPVATGGAAAAEVDLDDDGNSAGASGAGAGGIGAGGAVGGAGAGAPPAAPAAEPEKSVYVPVDPLQFWADRREKYPLLSWLARWYLCIAMFSAEVEQRLTQQQLLVLSAPRSWLLPLWARSQQ